MINKLIILIAALITGLCYSGLATSNYLPNDWYAMTERTDAFDSEKEEITAIHKGRFWFRCDRAMWSSYSNSFESLSFNINIKLKVDDKKVVEKDGKYSTGPWGARMVTESRYHTFELTPDDIKAFKKGLSLKTASNTGGGWKNADLDLRGFTNAYEKMCE